MEKKSSGWIWLPEWNPDQEKEAVFICFKKNIYLEDIPDSFRVKISADSRYKLYINGKFCEAGPSKGNEYVWFYDEVETVPYLKKGENEWRVIVLHYPDNIEKSNQSVFSTKTPGLFMISCEEDGDENTAFCTDSTWDVCRLSGNKIVSENPFFAPLQIYEKVTALKNIESWKKASEYSENELTKILRRKNLVKRTIPLMKRKPGKFRGIANLVMSSCTETTWNDFFEGKCCIEIPAHSEMCVDIDVGELMTGYLHLGLFGGGGAKITLLQSEGYVVSAPENPKNYDDLPVKGNRSDVANGILTGYTDTFIASGKGRKETPEIYEPFWFRTFRYIRMRIKTEEKSLFLQEFSYLETGYPLEVQSQVQIPDSELQDIWNISERTLRRCMHETYVDCPFYEQLQYVMDSRSQILYTYAVAADDRLARKCMDDLRRSQRADGLLNACYPSLRENVIPGFSIYYIGMVYDHMMYFGDSTLVNEHLSAIFKILDFYREHLDKRGIVKKIGGLNRPGNFWSFIDWTAEWKDTNGVPFVTMEGPITMESFLYLLGLQYTETLCLFVGKKQIAENLKKEEENLKYAINTYCRGKNGMYQDGPGHSVYSQHCQVFAILTETVSLEEGKKYLLETLVNKAAYAQCSVAMMYYLFRALEKCNLYEQTQRLWDSWKIMLYNHMTTCAEDPLQSRSDCHAWGALALYEFPSVILGVRPLAPGYSKFEIRPYTKYLSEASGSVITPIGKISVRWEKVNDSVYLEVDLPAEFKLIDNRYFGECREKKKRKFQKAEYEAEKDNEIKIDYEKMCEEERLKLVILLSKDGDIIKIS